MPTETFQQKKVFSPVVNLFCNCSGEGSLVNYYYLSKLIALVLSGVFLLFSFQNCAKTSNALNAGISTTSSFIGGNYFLSDSEIAAATIASPSDIQCLKEEDYSFTIPPNLKYFGILTAMGADGKDFEKWKQYTDSSLKMGNTQVIDVLNYATEEETINEFKKRVDYIYPYKQMIIINVQDVFFSRATGLIKSDYSSLWNKLVDVMKSYATNPFVAAYLYDEPFFSAKSKNIPVAALTQDLNTVGQVIKTSMNSMALVFIEAYPMVNSQMVIPEIYDWVGADCYVDNCDGKSIFQLYETIKSLLKPHQQLVVMPTAMVFKKPNDFMKADSVWMKDQFIKFAQWISQQSNVIASVSFIYHYSLGVEDIIGTESSCDASDIHRIYAKQAQTRSTLATYACTPSGTLNSYSMTGSIDVASKHSGLAGHYFVGGYDVIKDQWYYYDGAKFTLFNGDNTVTSIPSGSSGLSSLSGSIFTNSDLTPFKGGKIFLGYGLGAEKLTAWHEMLNNARYENCAVIPAQ